MSLTIKDTFFIVDVVEKSTDTIKIAEVTLLKYNFKKEEKRYIVKAFKSDVLEAKELKGFEAVVELTMSSSKNGYASNLIITEIRGLKAVRRKQEVEPAPMPEYIPNFD